MPQLSIITALHNKGPHVANTIRSMLSQTMQDWEMIVVENGSVDNGPEIVRQFTDPRIRLLNSPKQGPGAARNCGLAHAAGQWILFLDADDLMEPDHLAKLMAAGEADSAADIIAGGWKEFPDARPTELTIHRPSSFGFDRDPLLAGAVALAPWVLHAAILKKSVLNGNNLWPENLDDCPDEDTAFWFPVLLDSQVAWAQNFGALYRRLAAGSRSESGSLSARITGYSKIIEHNLFEAKNRGAGLSPHCYGAISMMFEVYYRKALASRDIAAAGLALDKASFWLAKCPDGNWNIRARKWFGIPAINSLKRILQGRQTV